MRRLFGNRKGSAAIEFAILAPAAILAIAGIIEFSLATFVGGLLESALADASRFGVTGFAAPGQSREERVRDIVAERTFGLLDMSRIRVVSLIYPSFEDIGQPEPFTDANGNGRWDAGEAFQDINGNGTWDADMGLAGLGGPGDIVVYRLEYDWPLLTPLFAATLGGLTLRSSMAVRNEPF